MKQLPNNYKRVLNLLRIGEDNPTSCKEISKTLGIHERIVQRIINGLIMTYHIPILGKRTSSLHGYYIPRNQAELLHGARTFSNQIQAEQKRLNVLLQSDLTSWQHWLKGE